MKRTAYTRTVVKRTVVAGALLLGLGLPTAAAATIAVPSYIYPGSMWTQMENAYPGVGLTVINPNSGPGTRQNSDYVTQVVSSRAKGLHVLGYVSTRYGARNKNQVKADIDKYFAWYQIDGILLDEASTSCSKQPYYADLNNYIKAKGSVALAGGTALTVLNPGTTTSSCYMTAGDILLTFEDTYQSYLTYTPASWEQNYDPSRFWHLVYATPEASAANAVALSKSRRAGWIYVTPDDIPNPWDTLPWDTYWESELENVQPLARWRASNDGSNLYYHLQYQGAWTWYRVYIDTDQDAGTGFAIGGIGADYLIENGNLYWNSGGGWSWTFVKPIAQTTGTNAVDWTVERVDVGEINFPESARLVFQVERTDGTIKTSSAYVHAYSDASGDISAYSAENDSNRIFYTATVAGDHAYKHIFIDADQNPATGYAYGGIGADYMIENDTLYKSGGGTWNWTAIGAAHMVVSGAVHTWWISRYDVKETKFLDEASNLVFHGGGGSVPDYTSPVHTHSFSD